MKQNENIKILGQNVILIPYEEYHVQKYHQWMSSTELQQLTASEPLSLEEEYEMQKTWRSDENKCTFLILNRTIFESTRDEIASLIGDTNLFFEVIDDDRELWDNSKTSNLLVAEAEIMIAEPASRSKGMGKEAMLLMLRYGSTLKVDRFIAKIGYDNVKSQQMFQKFHFVESSRSEVFREITYECVVNREWLDWIDTETQLFKLEKYKI